MSRFAAALEGWQTVEGLPSAFASARDSVDALLRDRGLRRTGPDTTSLALARGAEASARLELPSLRAEGVAGVADAHGGELAAAALRMNAELLALVPVVGRSPAQAIARLHAAAGLGPADSRGRPRAAEGVAADLQVLGRSLLDASGQSGQSGLAVSALAHAELAALDAFEHGSRLVARAMERLLLVSRGVDPAGTLVPEAGHLSLRAEYEPALAAYATGRLDGAAVWLAYAARAVVESLSASPLAQR